MDDQAKRIGWTLQKRKTGKIKETERRIHD